jgi:hypothetical protein
MSQTWGKFHGGKFVLEYAAQKVKNGKVLKFEVETFDKLRRYDIQFDELLPNGKTITKNLELKNWAGWWDNSLKSQFTKDLGKMKELGDTKWVFNKKGINQTMDDLRENVIKSLKKADGSPIEELVILMEQKGDVLKQVFGKKIDDVFEAIELLDELNNPKIFDRIFEVVEIIE